MHRIAAGRRARRGRARAIAVGALPVLSSLSAGAATITVTTTSQEVESDAEPSLQAAIFAANFDASEAIDPASPAGPHIPTGCAAGSGPDVIELAPGAAFVLRSGLWIERCTVENNSSSGEEWPVDLLWMDKLGLRDRERIAEAGMVRVSSLHSGSTAGASAAVEWRRTQRHGSGIGGRAGSSARLALLARPSARATLRSPPGDRVAG